MEQAKSEASIVKLDSGEPYKSTQKKSNKDKAIKILNCVTNYDTYSDVHSFLISMSYNMGDNDIKK